MNGFKDIEAKIEDAIASPSIEKAQRLMQSRRGLWLIAVVAFVESALPVPILTDPFLAAAVVLNRSKAVMLTLLTTVFSVLGGVVAYYSAALFFDAILSAMPANLLQKYEIMATNTDTNIFFLTIIGAVTPVPYTISAWVAAALQGGIAVFILASLVGRGFRYGIVAYCSYRFGPAALQYAKRYVGLTSLLVIALVVAYVWYKL